MGRRLAGLLATVFTALWALCAAAHPMPESRVWIDTTPTGLRLTLHLPLNRLEFAFGQPLADAPGEVLARHGEALARYLLLHVGARTANQGWQVLRPQLSVQGHDRDAELQAQLELRAPPGGDTRNFQLLFDAVTHEVRTHRVLVYLRQDWDGGFAGEPPRMLGQLDSTRSSLDVSLNPQQPGSGLRSLFTLGARHIAQGADHLLFLLTLLLVAPLLATNRRWSGQRPPTQALRRVAGVVTSFTAGHSLTLALGSSGLLPVIGAWVEAAVGASILVAAAHAWRPLLNRGELWMAGGFGLLHGLAFASSLFGAGLSTAQQVQAVLAFNLGIELVQLLAVLVAVPPLLVLAALKPRAYEALRTVLAGAAALAACVWLGQVLAPLMTPSSALSA
jgi:hypothetical protein